MRDDTLARYAGAFAAVGGGGWALANALSAVLEDCRRPLCTVDTAHATEFSAQLLFILSAMLLAAAGVGLVLLVGRQGALRLLGAVPAAVGAVTCAVGFALLWFVVALSDSPGGPYMDEAAVAMIGVLLGITLIAGVLLGIGGLPRAVGAFLLTGALLLASATNESMPTVVLMVGSGMCWCGAGSLLLLGTRDVPRTMRPARRSIAAE
jgi:hypothetical protein